MVLGGFLGVKLRLNVVAMRHVCMVAGLVVVADFVVLGGGAVVSCRVFVVVGGLAMVFGALVRHAVPRFPEETNRDRLLWRVEACYGDGVTPA